MTNEQQEQESSKKKRPKIGGISQYATIGGKRAIESPSTQELEHPDVQEAERLNVSTPKHLDAQVTITPDVQALERSDVQDTSYLNVLTPERSDLQAFGIPGVQKKQKPDRNRQTIYLEPDLDDWIRQRIISERKRLGHRVEISDIVNEAVRRMRDDL